MSKLEKSAAESGQVSLTGALSIGIGGMVGGGIFAVLGLAALLGGGATPVAFLIAGIVALLTAYSYAKLSVTYPNKGGTVIFIDKAFGVSFFTGSANNLLWISYIVALALYAVAFGNYAATFFGDQPSELFLHLLISAAIILPTMLNLLSAEMISKTEIFVVVFKLAILIVAIVAGWRSINTENLTPAAWKSFPEIIAAGMLIFIAYEGFELIANSAEEVKDYKRTLPRAFYGSVIFVIILYILIAIVTVGTLSPQEIQTSADFALAQAAKPSLGQFGFTLVAISAVLATFSAINATLYGAARLSFVIATEGELPAFIERKVWRQPVVGLLVTAALALLLANFFNIESISAMGSAGFLIIFAIVNAANFVKAEEAQSSRLLAGLGVFACLSALAILVWHTFLRRPNEVWVLLGMVGLALLIEGLYIFYLKHPHKKTRITFEQVNNDIKTIMNNYPLPSWNEGKSKDTIFKFIENVTTPGSSQYVHPEERIAVFDNDGTLWCEKPMYIQLDFILRQLAAQAEADPSLRTKQPWQAAWQKDFDWLGSTISKHYQGDDSDLHILLSGILSLAKDENVRQLEASAKAFIEQEHHPTLDRPYSQCIYNPMLELLQYLESNDFTNYIVSGGGRDFIRPVSQDLYRIPRQHVIGTTVLYRYQESEHGGEIIRQPKINFIDDGPEKPVQIWNVIGRRPILSAGNSNGDLEMLTFTGGSSLPALRILLIHDDAEREFEYTAGAEKVIEAAQTNSWTAVSMKHDWRQIFPSPAG